MKRLLFYSKKWLTGLIVVIGVVSVGESVLASTAVNADARYRKGADVNTLDHAGLRKAGVGIFEIKGYGHQIQVSSWDSFLAGQSYLGGYWNPVMTSSTMWNIIRIAEAMDADPGISYTLMDALNYESYAAPWITVDEITDIRCDGVVEYAYEFNNVWVWGKSNTGTSTGTPTNFDISYTAYTDSHNNLGSNGWYELSPYVQRGASGTKWTRLVGIPN